MQLRGVCPCLTLGQQWAVRAAAIAAGGAGIPLNLLEDFHSAAFLRCDSSPPPLPAPSLA